LSNSHAVIEVAPAEDSEDTSPTDPFDLFFTDPNALEKVVKEVQEEAKMADK
jgi:hypothetical protein